MVKISDEMYEQLRRILEKENGQRFSLEEAKVIGDGLIDLYSLLIELHTDEPVAELDHSE